jgi:hypothetical protein
VADRCARPVTTELASGTLDMPYQTGAGHAPGSPAGIITRLLTVGVRCATSGPPGGAALTIGTAGRPGDARDDEERAEPFLAEPSRTGVSIPILAIRILGTGHLPRVCLRCGGLAAADPGPRDDTSPDQAQCPPAIRRGCPEPCHAIEHVSIHGNSPQRSPIVAVSDA